MPTPRPPPSRNGSPYCAAPRVPRLRAGDLEHDAPLPAGKRARSDAYRSFKVMAEGLDGLLG